MIVVTIVFDQRFHLLRIVVSAASPPNSECGASILDSLPAIRIDKNLQPEQLSPVLAWKMSTPSKPPAIVEKPPAEPLPWYEDPARF